HHTSSTPFPYTTLFRSYITDFNSSFNFMNPAANENLQLTTIKVEGTNENNFFRSDFNDYKVTKHSTYLSNISIAFPISQKMKFGDRKSTRLNSSHVKIS